MKIIKLFLPLALSIMACQAGTNLNSVLYPEPSRTVAVSKEELLNINSVVLLPLVGDEHTRAILLDNSTFYDLLRKAAEEELDLATVDDPKQPLSARTMSDPVDLVRKFNVDGVLRTTLSQYNQRVGSRLAVSRPARVDFVMELFNANGKKVWEGSYHRQDEALSDNLLHAADHFRAGKLTGWRSAEEMLVDGFRTTLRKLSNQRKGQFIGE